MRDDSHDDQLIEAVRRLAAEQGKVEAADLLGINYRTLKAALEAKRLSPRVREAAESFFEESNQASSVDAEHSSADSEQRMVALELRVNDLSDQLLMLQQAVAALRARPPDRTPSQRRSDRPERVGEVPTRVPTRGFTAVVPAEAEPGEAWPKPLKRLVEQWREAKLDRATARHTLAWLRADRRMLELELQLAGEHQLTLPPADDPWASARRRRELRLRRTALHDTRVRLFWTRPLHLLMRTLTLSLWGR